MKVKSLIRALEKIGLKVETNANRQYYCKGKNYICSWYVQEENAICVKVRNYKDEDDMYSDYSAGFFSDTIKQVVKWIQE